MHWLNYHHLLYFWMVAREGGIARACDKLLVSQPTVSGQLRQLERSVGAKLLERQGRGLKLTDTGRVVFEYADEIFSTGQELMEVLRGAPSGRPLPLAVGVPDFLPKLVVFRLLQPVFRLPEKIQITCREGKLDQLLADLAIHRLDVVLADSQAGSQVTIRAFNHFLGECSVCFVGSAELCQRYREGFPASLDGAPVLLPTENTLLRRSLEHWFHDIGVEPDVVGEIEDSALLKVFAAEGVGLAPIPTVVVAETKQQYGMEMVGCVSSLRERFYAISVERKMKHPAVVAIADNARQSLFPDP